MGKIKLTVAYDGTDFSGFQRQPGKRTVQGTLEKLLTRVTGESISVIGSGRTDAGVHALGQVIHFKTRPVQIVHRDVRVPVVTHDWSDCTEEEREARVTRLLRSERQLGLDLTTAPLQRVHLARLPAG